MSVDDIVSLFVNNSAAVGCLIYFMVFNSKQIKALTDTIASLKEAITVLTKEVDKNEGHE